MVHFSLFVLMRMLRMLFDPVMSQVMGVMVLSVPALF
jgi:hypothetical protein